MQIPKYFIVADRGEVKLFEFTHHGGRPPSYHLQDSFVVEEAHQSYRERFSDQAGSFPNNSARGNAHSSGEHHELKTETDRRIHRQLAHAINGWLTQNRSPAWAFAAPSEINAAILKEVTVENRNQLHQNLAEDLVHLPAAKLLGHLEAVTTSDIT